MLKCIHAVVAFSYNKYLELTLYGLMGVFGQAQGFLSITLKVVKVHS